MSKTYDFDATVQLSFDYGNGEGHGHTFDLDGELAFQIPIHEDRTLILFLLGVACIKTAINELESIQTQTGEQASQFKTAVKELSDEIILLRS